MLITQDTPQEQKSAFSFFREIIKRQGRDLNTDKDVSEQWSWFHVEFIKCRENYRYSNGGI